MDKGDLTAAGNSVDAVIGVKADSTEVVRLQTLAKAKAVVLAREGNGEAGGELIETLIGTLNPSDVELAAVSTMPKVPVLKLPVTQKEL